MECEAVDGFELPFVQEFEFVPVHGEYHGRWRELEIVTYRTEHALKIWFEVDRHKRVWEACCLVLLAAIS